MLSNPKELNDSLDDLLAAPAGEVRSVPTSDRAPVDYKPNFDQVCGKCGGSGRFRGYSGRTFGACFACKGAGKLTFKTSPEARAKSRASAANRKARTAQEVADEATAALKIANPDVYAWLVANLDRNTFATDLWNKMRHFGGLTEGQIGAVQRGIEKDAQRKAEAQTRAEAAPVADTAGIDRLKLAFDTAIANAAAKGRGFKMPRITIGGVVISPAKETSQNAGALYVKEAGQYLGKIRGGRFFAVRECTPEQEKKVLAFVADPKAAAIAYGIETGVCCICNATLTNKVSIEAGIGPICGAKFGW